MPYDEVQGWFAYFKERPPGWREDNRAALLARAAGVEKRPEELFHSLKMLSKAQANREAAIPIEKLQAQKLQSSGFLARLLAVAKTNTVDWSLNNDSQITS